MILTHFSEKRRRGATLVEMALVMIPLTMLFFGIFVYGQLLMDWGLLITAAQEGCRFALANNTDTSINTEIQTVVNNYLAPRSNGLSGITVSVNGTHQGALTTNVNILSPGDPVTVTVSGNYRFPNVVPLIPLPSSMTLSSSATMICEGGP
jgi:Flp pilus assembly protein TadG